MIDFNNALIQAPLAGYSCAPFRGLAWRLGKPDYCYTEMLSAKHIYSGARQKKRYVYKAPTEGPVCYQLSGDDPVVMAFAAKTVASWGADLIDINCGCPMPKIRSKREGSKLLASSEKLIPIIDAIKSAVDIPVLVKIRVDSNSSDNYNQAVANAINNSGADALTIHGRHWSEKYDTPVNYDEIKFIRDQVKIPVIGNGDISDTLSAKMMLDKTNCNGLMIARASVGQPWIFEKIRRELAGETFTPPDIKTIGQLFLEHIKGLIDIEGAELPAVLQSRKFGKYYARGKVDETFFEGLYKTRDFDVLVKLVETYFR